MTPAGGASQRGGEPLNDFRFLPSKKHSHGASPTSVRVRDYPITLDKLLDGLPAVA